MCQLSMNYNSLSNILSHYNIILLVYHVYINIDMSHILAYNPPILEFDQWEGFDDQSYDDDDCDGKVNQD